MKTLTKILLILLIINCQFLINNCNAQNLVPNPSFELGPAKTTTEWQFSTDSTCAFVDTLGGPLFWTVTNSSPDRLVEGDFFPCGWDNDSAAFGASYVIMAGSVSSSESGKTILLSPLIADSIYHLSYYAQVETFASSLLFPTIISFVFNNGDTIFSPTISDSTQWVRYDTTFTASSGATEMELLCANGSFCGFKIDSISLEKVTVTSISDIFLQNSIKIFPNPTNNGIIDLHFSSNKNIEYSLYNTLGKEIIIGSFENKKKLDLTNHSHGIYFLRFQVDDSVLTKKLIYH